MPDPQQDRENASLLSPRVIALDAGEPLPLTGERTAPDIPDENYWFRRHEVAYRFAQRLVEGTSILDAGAGEGYGTAMLAEVARWTLAADLEIPVLQRAHRRYGIDGVGANLVTLPVRSASVEAVVSMQTIEHLHSPVDFVAECARVLRPGGLFVLSTPNRLTFSPDGTVRNPFHTFEFAPTDLAALLARSFADVTLWGVGHGFRIRAWELRHRESLAERLIREPAPSWSPALRRLVHSIGDTDFRMRTTGLDASLDLVALARAR